ncbi:hypothetical protein K439DRAFT_1623058 [Ramaria rubella]|nr:hypothetical protein K439DRAFT_1623058 [Ramaria rubella]
MAMVTSQPPSSVELIIKGDDISPPMMPDLGYSLKARRMSIASYWGLTVLFSLVIPIVVFYPLYLITSLSLETILGITTSLMGAPQVIEVFYRQYIMVRRDRGPIREDGKKAYLDLFQVEFVFGVLIVVVMYTLSCSLVQPIPKLFLIAPATLVISLGLQLLLTLTRFRTPFRVNSTLAGARVKPGVFYVMEDVVAVEGGGGKPFRERWATSYNESPALRDVVRDLTIWWGAGSILVFGISAVVVFVCDLIVSAPPFSLHVA